MVHIRRARSHDDLTDIHHIHAACFSYNDTHPGIGEGDWWLALDGDKPVAFCGARELDDGLYYMCRAGVIESYRGRGLQRRLIRVRTRRARALGIDEVITDTAPHNVASSNNLIREGFLMYRPGYTWAGLDALYWRKALSPTG